ncbi:MAG: ATP-binding cassette domain-containing protein [Methanoregula sp.]|jgi:energy-coupling factor transport system ATP-binding protein|nr:ATP-binding cassette domain-containing protein [Methanoregula sp.]
MEVPGMRLVLDDATVTRGEWHITAHGTFPEGIHLISGNVGSGKSTLALIMAGLLPPAAGSMISEEISSRMISFQFPEYHITGTTVREECESWGLDPNPLLSSIGLKDRHDCDPLRLSRGELKRLHLACILAYQYDLLILDEPFSSLDVCEKRRICSILSGRNRGITILFTHEQAIFPRVRHIWEIHDNQLHSCGSPPDGLRHWQHAPAFIRKLVDLGKVPKNISPEDLEAAACAI